MQLLQHALQQPTSQSVLNEDSYTQIRHCHKLLCNRFLDDSHPLVLWYNNMSHYNSLLHRNNPH